MLYLIFESSRLKIRTLNFPLIKNATTILIHLRYSVFIHFQQNLFVNLFGIFCNALLFVYVNFIKATRFCKTAWLKNIIQCSGAEFCRTELNEV